MTNTRKIKVPEIPPAEYWETHNRSGTKGIKVSILEDTKPDNDLSRKLFAPNASANLRYTLGAMNDEQFKAFMKDKEDEFLKILLGVK